MSTIAFVGLASCIEGEDRALAYLEIQHNNNTYNWQIYVPTTVTNIDAFIESVKQDILNDINAKELVWANLNPKTRTIVNEFNQEIVVDISKDEIVKPNIPDYFALRRKLYPSIGEQLDAIWKGVNSPEYIEMKSRIAVIKAQYPKFIRRS